jgi:hypothetical protein
MIQMSPFSVDEEVHRDVEDQYQVEGSRGEGTTNSRLRFMAGIEGPTQSRPGI